MLHDPNLAWTQGVINPAFAYEGPQSQEFCGVLDNWQICHTFYNDGHIKSRAYNCLLPLLRNLEVRSPVRVKANLTPRREKKIVGGLHTDTSWDDHKTAVFYVNTNNGGTVFEDGTEVTSLENRIVIFSSGMKHSGFTTTDSIFRLVINLNYY